MNENKNLDPKLEEALKGIWDSLTDEQKEKAKACEAPDELIKLAGKEGIELPDELLDAVAGGYIYFNKEKGYYEMIMDSTGEVIDSPIHSADVSAARLNALIYGQSAKELSSEQLNLLQKHPGVKFRC